jgi:hypothetical protein
MEILLALLVFIAIGVPGVLLIVKFCPCSACKENKN